MLFIFRFIYNLILVIYRAIEKFFSQMFRNERNEQEKHHSFIDLTDSSSCDSDISGQIQDSSFFFDWSESRICQNKQLTDNEIFAACLTLKQQFKQIKGLFDPVALRSRHLKKNSFYIEFPDRFVQILHDGKSHWFTMSNVWSRNKNQVQIYDSWYRRNLYVKNPMFKFFLRRLLVKDEDTRNTRNIECSVEPVQRQNNDIMCGVYAIVFATDLCFGINPSNKIYDQDLLRQHLYKCLTDGYFQQFPSKTSTQKLFKSDSFIITC